MKDWLRRLLDTLGAAGLQPGADDVADAVWLAQHWAETPVPASEPATDPDRRGPRAPGGQRQDRQGPAPAASARAAEERRQRELYLPRLEAPGGGPGGRPLPSPTGSVLP